MDDATLSALCAMFDLGEPSAKPAPVSGGLTNRLWRVVTARGVFAIKQMNPTIEPRDEFFAWIERAFALEQAAFAAGVAMPRPVPAAASGRCLGELAREPGPPLLARVHEWADGETLRNGHVYPADVLARAAAALARIHALAMPADGAAQPALRVFGADYWRKLAGRFDRERMELAGELRALLAPLAELEAYVAAARADPAPLLMSHRDADPKNFLRGADGELLLVDWDQAGPVNPRHDLANAALVWAGVHAQEPDAQAARAFVDAYRAVAGADVRFQPGDLAELVALRLAWLEFNAHRALGERVLDGADRAFGMNVIRRNVVQLPRFARSLDAWLAVLSG